VAGEGSRFADKGFGARLVAYPLFVLVAPAVWWLVRGRRGGRAPWAGFALIGAPFLVDVTGNSLNLYDTVWWWDDANHFLNWFLLCSGLALVVGVGAVTPTWARRMVVVGGGAVLALVWEIGEWATFIRHSTELATAYEDTLGDMTLGTCGALVAALVPDVAAWLRHRARGTDGDGAADPAVEPPAG
jgi:hypothetical protein